MTTFIRDMSHYDTDLSLTGYAGTTHKITEGKGYVDPKYAARMPGFRATNRVLGSYHVLHTADPAGQLQFWIEQQDKLTPWWRDWPHWIMQIDAEKWPGDPVTLADGRTYTGPLTASAFAGSLLADDAIAEARQARQSTTVSFATMLKAANLPGLQVCYASRGQFGDTLSGIPLDLWNAAYRSSSYPGDNSSDWRPYSGRTPVFWQYTSTPYDKNAFRGTVDQLLAYVSKEEDFMGFIQSQDDFNKAMDAWAARAQAQTLMGNATWNHQEPNPFYNWDPDPAPSTQKGVNAKTRRAGGDIREIAYRLYNTEQRIMAAIKALGTKAP